MCIKVKANKIEYEKPPEDRIAYTNEMDGIYTRWTKAYDRFIAVFWLWRKWVKSVLPYVRGKKLLEVSFGTGYLLTQYPPDIELHGIDYNSDMVDWARAKLKKVKREAELLQGNVEDLPYQDGFFDTVVVTFAFSGYPDGNRALFEMLRVLKPGGRLLLVDYDYPPDRNLFGFWITRIMVKSGDLIKDIHGHIRKTGCAYESRCIGSFKSAQLFIIKKPRNPDE
ncbi:MAG: class I SAM-dependent methyltransferase [Clostridia bacterium]|nr:class I SAM-dependent methyltransferase [Clostridia bacterium]